MFLLSKTYVNPKSKLMKTTYALLIVALMQVDLVQAQTCPTSGITSINSYPNTYYSAGQSTLTAGSTSFTIGSAKYGSNSIKSGDILLIIQMQGAQFSHLNSKFYGDSTGSGSGYYNNTNLLAGNMEYVVASNNVSLSGGTLNITTGLAHSYQNSSYGTDGQYTYQIIRVPVYYDLKLTGTIYAPRWDGVKGGVIVLYAVDTINLNGQTVDASGRGFRGGGGRSLSGYNSANTDYYSAATHNANASKGEGIAGLPRYVNDSDAVLFNTGVEGYPNGSYAMGAPGNAGGGGTDGDPVNNDQNTGGGGGGNGGVGGVGGNAWSSGLATGGRPGALFAQASSSRLIMGGGGGAGTTNNATGTPSAGFASSGAAGGGIVIIMAGSAIAGTGTIKANGAAGNTTVQNDGAGGGGAGGSILIYSNNGVVSNITAQATGGDGGSNEVSGGPNHGPGGGGGGGVIYSDGTLASANISGGNAGTTGGQSTNYGANSGATGVLNTHITESVFDQFPLHCTVLASGVPDLSAVVANNAVTLNWTVPYAANDNNYTVERGTDGINFSDIASTPAYQFIDWSAAAVGGILYYRIRGDQANGPTAYSQIVSVQFNARAAKFALYPNPAQNIVTLSFTATVPESVNLRLVDLRGSQLWTGIYQAQTGMNTMTIDCIRTLPEGIYFLQWSDGSTQQTQKIVVRH